MGYEPFHPVGRAAAYSATLPFAFPAATAPAADVACASSDAPHEGGLVDDAADTSALAAAHGPEDAALLDVYQAFAEARHDAAVAPRRPSTRTDVFRLGPVAIPFAAVSLVASCVLHAGVVAAGVMLWHARPWHKPAVVATGEAGDDGDGGPGPVICRCPDGSEVGATLPDEPPELPEELASAPPPAPVDRTTTPDAPPPEPTDVPQPTAPQPEAGMPDPVIGVGPQNLIASTPVINRRAPFATAAAPSDAPPSDAGGPPGPAAPQPPSDLPTSPNGVAGGTGAPSNVVHAPVVTPPRPRGARGGGRRGAVGGNGMAAPEYPAASRRNGEQGVVVLEGEVLPDGTVGNVTVVSDPGYPRLVTAAIEAFRRTNFEPKRVDGKAAAGKQRHAYRFELR